MPVTPPPAMVAPALPDDYKLPSGMIGRERQVWLAPPRAARDREPCPEAKGSEIVVCAQREDDSARDRLGTPIPDAPTAMEELKRKTTVSLGPAQAHPDIGRSPGIPEPAPYFGVKVGVKF
jgi:hypothetical protein